MIRRNRNPSPLPRRFFALSNKLIISFLTLVIVPSSLIGLISYKKSASLLEEQAATAYNETLAQAAINITYRLKEAENISQILFVNPEVQTILRRELLGYPNLSEQLLDDFTQLRKTLYNLESVGNIFRVRLFVQGDSLYSKENNNIFPISKLPDDVQESFSTDPSGQFWKSTYLQNYLFEKNFHVVTLFRVIKDMTKLDNVLGIAAFDIEERVLYEVFQEMNLTDDSSILVYHQDQLITDDLSDSISSYDINELLTLIRPLENNEMSSLYLLDREYLVLFHPIEIADWTIAALIPVDQISGSSNIIGQFTIWIVLTFGSVAALSAIGLSHTLTRGLRLLYTKMKVVEKGIYGEYIEVRGNDEISVLQSQYNQMIARIKELIEEVYKIKISKQAAELKALESQINPHFLYNTLDTVKWMALKMKATNIVAVIDALSRFFRLSLNQGKEFTTLEHEINHIKAYMQIQDIRFSNKIRYQFEIDPDVMQTQILKLLLQPLVENAIVHGIQSKEDPSGLIIIRAWREEDLLLIEVLDDGVGINEIQANTILQQNNQGYGAKNVNQRIKLYYTNNSTKRGTNVDVNNRKQDYANYGLSYFPVDGGGCRVRITLPYEFNNDD